jgi:hypothetical protein
MGKLGPKSTPMIMIGYAIQSKGYLLMDPKTGKRMESRDVIIDEGNFDRKSEHHKVDFSEEMVEYDEIKFGEPVEEDTQANEQDSNDKDQAPIDEACTTEARHEEIVETGEDDQPCGEFYEDLDNDEHLMDPQDNLVEDEPDQIIRDYLNSKVEYVPIDDPPARDITAGPLHEKRQSKKPCRYAMKVRAVNETELPRVVTETTGTDYIPTTAKAAKECPEAKFWKKAMDEEMENHYKLKTFKMVPRSKGLRPLPTKWVFTKKYKEDGSCVYRARLVMGGHRQKKGFDYEETFASTVRNEAIRLVLDMASKLDYEVRQIDFVTAFLNANLNEVIYARQPDGYDDQTGDVIQLLKAIYGLKQSPRQWEKKVRSILNERGFKPLKSNSSVYTNGKIVIAVFVDDFIIAGKDVMEIDGLIKNVAENYKIKDLGECRNILGMQWTRDRSTKTSWLSQTAYVKKILKRFELDKMHPTETPASEDTKYDPNDTNLYHDPEKYMEAVGVLIYLSTCTRPDLAYAVSKAARKMKNPSHEDWKAVKRIFRYLNGTQEYGLQLGGEGFDLTAYVDADWGRDPETKRSRSGNVLYCGSTAISWYSKLQPGRQALSTVEAEYRSASGGAQDLLWIQNVMGELSIENNLTMICNGSGEIKADMRCDNQGAIAAAKNPTQHSRLRHIDLKYHHIRDLVEDGTLKIEYCPTSEMIADIFTKPLGRKSFQKFRDALGVTRVGTN